MKMIRRHHSRKNPQNKSKPAWDDTVSDMSVHKISQQALEKRKRICKPNMERSNHENVFHRLYGPEHPLKEMYGQGEDELWKVIDRAEEAFAEVHDLIGDSRKKYRGVPSVTRAPGTARSLDGDGSVSTDQLRTKPASNGSVVAPILNECPSPISLEASGAREWHEATATSNNTTQDKDRDDIQRFYKFVLQEQASDQSTGPGETPSSRPHLSRYHSTSPHWLHVQQLCEVLRDLEKSFPTPSEDQPLSNTTGQQSAEDDLGALVMSELAAAARGLVSKMSTSMRKLEESNASLRIAMEALTLDLMWQRQEHAKLQEAMMAMEKRHEEEMRQLQTHLPPPVRATPGNQETLERESRWQVTRESSSQHSLLLTPEANNVEDVDAILQQVQKLRLEERRATERIVQLMDLRKQSAATSAQQPERNSLVLT